MPRGLVTPKRLLSLIACSLAANICSGSSPLAEREGMYIGVFGGGGRASPTDLQQRGAVFLNPPNRLPFLPVNAQGSTGTSSRDVAVGGAHLGYEWRLRDLDSNWSLTAAAELEGLYLGSYSPTAEMPVRPRFLGTQYVTFPLTAGVLLTNAVFNLRTPWSDKLRPYVGAGIGVAFVSVRGSDSQNPSEPGINHFNTDRDASDSALAFQFKAGLKSEIHRNLYLTLEYRYLHIDPTSYIFGSTNYPGVHLPTTSWHVDLDRQQYHLVTAGLQYKF